MRSARAPGPVARVLLVTHVSLGAACGRGAEAEAEHGAPMSDMAEMSLQESRPLPEPRPAGDRSLEETLARRRSVRAFADAALTAEEIGQLAWAAQGVTSEAGYRTAPSAGALYPLELYVSTADGVFHYDPKHHRLETHRRDDRRAALREAAWGQEALGSAPAVFVFAAVYERTAAKYGSRAPRYVHMEVGHAAQNLLLEAVALGLGAVPIGAFDDHRLSEALGLPADRRPLYLVPVGHPE